MSLVEVLVAAGFLAVAVIMVLSLMPAGILSLHRAQTLETATALAQGLLEEAPVPDGPLPPPQISRVQMNGVAFVCTRSFRRVDPELTDVVAKVTWEGSAQPVELWLRHYRPSGGLPQCAPEA